MNEILGNNIMILRKENGLTQEQLASALGISFQAVSKWETGNSCPDISTLPLLADLFSVSVDQLIGRVPLMGVPEEQKQPTREENPTRGRSEETDSVLSLPWADDDTFFAVLFHGHELVGYLAGDKTLEEAKKHFVFQYEGPVQNLHSDFSVEIDGDVFGSVEAGTSVNCGDVKGDVVSGGEISCGDVGGSLRAKGSVNCGDVTRGLEAGGSVNCGDVGGGVNAGGNVDCGDVGGSVNAGGSVDCGDVGNSVFAGARADCGSVNGTVVAGNRFSGEERFKALEPLDDLDRELDEMIDRQVEDSIKLGMSMSDLGEDIGQKISAAVQRAVDFSTRFGKKNTPRKDESEEP